MERGDRGKGRERRGGNERERETERRREREREKEGREGGIMCVYIKGSVFTVWWVSAWNTKPVAV